MIREARRKRHELARDVLKYADGHGRGIFAIRAFLRSRARNIRSATAPWNKLPMNISVAMTQLVSESTGTEGLAFDVNTTSTINIGRLPVENFSSNGELCLNCLCQPTIQAHWEPI